MFIYLERNMSRLTRVIIVNLLQPLGKCDEIIPVWEVGNGKANYFFCRQSVIAGNICCAQVDMGHMA